MSSFQMPEISTLNQEPRLLYIEGCALLNRERVQSALREIERKRPCCSRARAGKLKIIGINESNQCQYRSISDVDKKTLPHFLDISNY